MLASFGSSLLPQDVISEIEIVCLLGLAVAKCCARFYCAGGTGAEQAAAGLVLAEGLAAVTAVQSTGLRSVNAARRVKAFISETNAHREVLLRYYSCVSLEETLAIRRVRISRRVASRAGAGANTNRIDFHDRHEQKCNK